MLCAVLLVGHGHLPANEIANENAAESSHVFPGEAQ